MLALHVASSVLPDPLRDPCGGDAWQGRGGAVPPTFVTAIMLLISHGADLQLRPAAMAGFLFQAPYPRRIRLGKPDADLSESTFGENFDQKLELPDPAVQRVFAPPEIVTFCSDRPPD